jgi:hypothetical protein
LYGQEPGKDQKRGGVVTPGHGTSSRKHGWTREALLCGQEKGKDQKKGLGGGSNTRSWHV